jgi:ATP-dependent protease ClpP protease subunit
MMPNSRLMIHYGYNSNSGHTKVFEKWADEGKRLNYQLENIYIDRILQFEKANGKSAISKGLYDILRKQKEFEYPPVEIPTPKFTSINIEDQLRVYVKDMLNYDTIIYPEDCVAIGLADEIQQEINEQ